LLLLKMCERSSRRKRNEMKKNKGREKLLLSYRPLDLYSVLNSSSAPFPGFRQHETQCSYSKQHCASASQPAHENGRGEVEVVVVAAALLFLL